MKTNNAIVGRKLFPIVAALVGAALGARAAEATAFELAKEANRYVGKQSKDKIVQIRSEKSVGSLTPNIWYVVLYDPTATLKAVEVKFGAGKMLDVKHPVRLLEPVTGGDTPLDKSKLRVDSDQAMQTALKEPLLKNLKVTATELKLERVGEGVLGLSGAGEAVWKVKLWAAKLREPSLEADVGEVWLSANNGKALKSDLHLNRLD